MTPGKLPFAIVKAWNSAEPPIPPNKPRNAPVPVVRAQNIPRRKVANSGAFTKPNTNWMISMALLYNDAKYAQAMLNNIPTTVKKINPDLTSYVVERATIALFDQIEKEEANIRANPVARTTEILKKVFGSYRGY